jgi:hypothetical protein
MPAKLAHKEHPEQKKKGSLRRVDQQDASHGVSAYGPAKDAARLKRNPGAQVAYRTAPLMRVTCRCPNRAVR